MLAPRRAWYFRRKPTDIIRGYVEDEPSAPLWEMHKQLAEHLETDFTANESNMKPLFRAYQLANLALAGEVIVWIIILIGRYAWHQKTRTRSRNTPAPGPPDPPQPPRINPSAAEQRGQQLPPPWESRFERKVVDTSKDARRGR